MRCGRIHSTVFLATIGLALTLRGAEYRVHSAAEIARVENDLRAGDTVVLADGNWKDQAIVIESKATPEAPITFRAETPGKVILTGKSSVVVGGEHVIVTGLLLRNSESTGDGMRLIGRHCRLTESAVVGGACKFFVRLFGVSNRMDHCYLAGKTSDSPTLQIEVEGQPNYHRVDHNHFGPRPPLGRNGGETIRVGYSWQSMTNSRTIVEQNLFDRCDGELEIISNKSCENVYRGNTFLDCAGMLTLRHGNRCTVDGNFFFGHHKRGSGGIRVIGDDHTIVNNYIDGVEQGGFWITAGIPDSPLNGYFPARNCVIAFNTVVDSSGPTVDLSAGLGGSRRTLLPEKITIANNVFAVTDSPLLKGVEGQGFKWIRNIASTMGAERQGLKVADPKLVRAKDGLWRPGPDSPVRGAAEAFFAAVKSDCDGQPRKGHLDAGCDQMSEEPVTNRPLTPKDVGPSWMDRSLAD
jgi:poly(beta-D-mannuronate) lyase